MWWRNLNPKQIVMVLKFLMASESEVGYKKPDRQEEKHLLMFGKTDEFNLKTGKRIWQLEIKLPERIDRNRLKPVGMYDDMRENDTLSDDGKDMFLREILSDIFDMPHMSRTDKEILHHRFTQIMNFLLS